MKSNKYKPINNNRIIITNFENSIPKKRSNISNGNLYLSNFSIITNTDVYTNKSQNRVHTTSSPAKSILFNTLDDYTRDIFYLSKKKIEHDIQLSSLKKKLATIKEERKKSEISVKNKKKKIIELQKEEQKSLKQLEKTKRYIKKIIDNRKKHNNTKNFDIKITKINNIFQTNKSPNHKLFSSGNLNCLSNTWFPPTKKKSIIKNQTLTHGYCLSGIDNSNIKGCSTKSSKLKIDINQINTSKTINYNNYTNYNTENRRIYNRKKIKMSNSKKNDNKNFNNKRLKENLIRKLKKDEEEKIRIQKEIEEIEKEQNNMFNNFYENFGVYSSYKTLDLNDNFFNNNDL